MIQKQKKKYVFEATRFDDLTEIRFETVQTQIPVAKGSKSNPRNGSGGRSKTGRFKYIPYEGWLHKKVSHCTCTLSVQCSSISLEVVKKSELQSTDLEMSII